MRKKKKDYTVVPNQAMSREELDIACMAAQLKTAYKDKWMSVYKRPYTKVARADNQKVWTEAAKIVIDMHGTAESFVEAQFSMSKMICLPHNLATPTARKRYKSYLIASGIDYPAVRKLMVDTNDRIDPGKAELKSLVTTHVEYMMNSYGISDLASQAHVDVVTTSPWLFDPLAACIVLGDHPEVIELFKDGAAARLTEYPYLKQAMLECGYEEQLTAILTE